VPKKHLVQNIGFVKEATHTKIKYKDWFNDLKTEEIESNKKHPEFIKPEINYDKWLSNKVFKVNKFYIKNNIKNNKIYKSLKPFHNILKSIYKNFT
tara:strand:+ start:303 stop:590 length:288 start_codon:yes stop_codon:yes gene_type:complete